MHHREGTAELADLARVEAGEPPAFDCGEVEGFALDSATR